ncbi:hypothetical protein QTP88_022378 [Uroleucon formosanum]
MGGRILHRVGGFSEDAGLCDRYKHLSVQERTYSKNTKGTTGRSDVEVTWDFQCQGSIRGDSSESGDPDRKTNYARKNPKKSAQKLWLRPENGPLNSKVHPYINAYNRIREDVYYDVQQSTEIAVELLMYQFDDNSESVLEFVQDMFLIFDKRIPKCNTLAILAPPNSGKIFFDAVAAFFINYGILGTVNKTNSFAFMEAAGKRLILWNDRSNFEANHVKELKAFLGSDSCRVQVKYQDNAPIKVHPSLCSLAITYRYSVCLRSNPVLDYITGDLHLS